MVSALAVEEVLRLKHVCEPPLAVIALLVETKLPAQQWRDAFETGPWTDDKIRGVWARWDGALNPGLACGPACGPGIMVVDADGEAAVRWCEAELPATRVRVRTRSGCHYYYAYPDDGAVHGNRSDVLGSKKRFEYEAQEKLGLDLRAHKRDGAVAQAQESERVKKARARALEQLEMGPTIDVRGRGGQVVAPGAIHPSGFVYEWVEPWTTDLLSSLPVFDPAWFEGRKWTRPAAKGGPVSIAKLRAKRADIRRAESRDLTYDEKRRRAEGWLARTPGAVSGNRGHDHTFYVANRLIHGFMIDPGDAFELMKGWNDSCQPPWTMVELAHKVEDASNESAAADGYMLEDRPEFLAAKKIKVQAEYVAHVDEGQVALDPDDLDFDDDATFAPPVEPLPNSPVTRPVTTNVLPLGEDERAWQKLWSHKGVDYMQHIHGRRRRWTRLKVDGRWTLPPYTNNLKLCIQHGADFGHDLRFDRLKMMSYVDGEMVDDSTLLKFKEVLDDLWQCEIPDRRVHAAIEGAAQRDAYEPVMEFLNSLPAWDGVDRFPMLLTDILKAQDTPLNRTMIRHQITLLVARGMRPGIKGDTVLFLVGGQGYKKSQFFRILVDGHVDGNQWFTDAHFGLKDKDGKMLIGTSWGCEWSESEHAKSDKMIDTVKQFLSQQEEEFRPPYGKYLIKRPRRCVFFASSNDRILIHDATGSRRFYIIGVSSHIDLDLLLINRKQILAQCLVLFRRHMQARDDKARAQDAGDVDALRTAQAEYDATRWWFDGAEDEERERVMAEYQSRSAWHEDIDNWVRERRNKKNPADWPFTIGQVIEDAMGVPKERKSRRMQNEVKIVLRDIGCAPYRDGASTIIGGVKGKFWMPPELRDLSFDDGD